MNIIPIEILLHASTIDQISGVLVSPNGEYTPEQVASLTPDAAVLYDWVMDNMDELVEHCVISDAAGYVVESSVLRPWAVWYGLQDFCQIPWNEIPVNRAALTALKNWMSRAEKEPDRLEIDKTLKMCLSELEGYYEPRPVVDTMDIDRGSDRFGDAPDEPEPAEVTAAWAAYQTRQTMHTALMSLLRVAVGPLSSMDTNMNAVTRSTRNTTYRTMSSTFNRFGLLSLLQSFMPEAPCILPTEVP